MKRRPDSAGRERIHATDVLGPLERETGTFDIREHIPERIRTDVARLVNNWWQPIHSSAEGGGEPVVTTVGYLEHMEKAAMLWPRALAMFEHFPEDTGLAVRAIEKADAGGEKRAKHLASLSLAVGRDLSAEARRLVREDLWNDETKWKPPEEAEWKATGQLELMTALQVIGMDNLERRSEIINRLAPHYKAMLEELESAVKEEGVFLDLNNYLWIAAGMRLCAPELVSDFKLDPEIIDIALRLLAEHDENTTDQTPLYLLRDALNIRILSALSVEVKQGKIIINDDEALGASPPLPQRPAF